MNPERIVRTAALVVALLATPATLVGCGGARPAAVEAPPQAMCGDTGRPYVAPAPGPIAPPVQQGAPIPVAAPGGPPAYKGAGPELMPASPLAEDGVSRSAGGQS